MRGHSHNHPVGDQDAVIRWAWLYDLGLRVWWRRGKRWRDELLDRLDLQPGQRVLDIGSGTGQLAFALADRVTPGGSVDGVDAGSEMVSRAERANRRRGRPVTFATARAQQLPFPEGTFDAVTCTLALHHVARDDRATAVGEMYRVLRPGGRVLIAEFDGAGGAGFTPLARLHTRHPEHARALDEAVGLLTGAGFTTVTRGPTTINGIGHVVASRPANP
ncbi:MAG TPA: methyltransferase domain-containing protein [Propionibacteriaceae bacterium]|nr:methyltransferase domain-containing protein [Propionibacteriaceae bacterium]